jgi:DNA (cytosine-5)-methyltransferase 1
MSHLSSISLFTGAGGLDYGFEAAGFETLAAVENDPDACQTLRMNRSWPVLARLIETVSSEELLSTAATRKGEVGLVLGGAPCQPFSKAAYWAKGETRRLDDPRANTLAEYMRCVEDLLPVVFVMENVHGIKYTGKEEGFLFLEQRTTAINRRHGTRYRLSWAVLDSASYGVPQHRQRFILVAHREGRLFRFPDPTHGEEGASLFGMSFSPYLTAWDAIGHAEKTPLENLSVKGRWADLLPSIPEGENYLWHTNRKGGTPLFGWRTCYWSFLLKLAKNRPSWTLQAQPGPAIGPFHWKNRRLSVWEMCRLQTFPLSIHLHGSRNRIQRQLGNAVPSLLGEVIAREVVRQFFPGHKLPPSPTLAILPRRPIPDPESIASVPVEFLHLAGDHPDHPGTGLGKGATRRFVLGTGIPNEKKNSTGTNKSHTDEPLLW